MTAITNGNWSMHDYRNALGDKLAVAPLPAGPAGPASPILEANGIFFNPNSLKQEAALLLGFYLTGQKSQTEMMNTADHVPVNIHVKITDPLINNLVTAFENGYIYQQVPQLGKYWENFCGMETLFEQGGSVADWLENATNNANR